MAFTLLGIFSLIISLRSSISLSCLTTTLPNSNRQLVIDTCMFLLYKQMEIGKEIYCFFCKKAQNQLSSIEG